MFSRKLNIEGFDIILEIENGYALFYRDTEEEVDFYEMIGFKNPKKALSIIWSNILESGLSEITIEPADWKRSRVYQMLLESNGYKFQRGGMDRAREITIFLK
jgi:hypothetical protein